MKKPDLKTGVRKMRTEVEILTAAKTNRN